MSSAHPSPDLASPPGDDPRPETDNPVPDHRRIGRDLGVFASDDRCGSGLPLWLPAGSVIRSEIERFVVDLERAHGYQHVYTPHLAKRELYERSGHWAHYRDDMYPAMAVGSEEAVLRPMNCPHHILVFEAERPSARELPWRVAELGTMFRFERSGVVSGLSRVRQMTLNDGHVFCLPDQIDTEIASILSMVAEAYRALGLPAPRHRLSLRGEGAKYVADDDLWARAESVLRSVLDGLGVPYDEAPDEAAFYGPKIDLQVSDPQGREETLSTVQVDFLLPERFGLVARAPSGDVRPVMIHRSIVSTMERMVAHLLEVHGGALPVWLAPAQVRVLPVVDDAADHADRVLAALRGKGVRARLDDRDATLGARIRAAQQDKVPYVAVVGRNEASDDTVAVRLRDGRRLDPMPPERFADLVAGVAANRGADLGPAT
ncbi:MAG: threonine--tRNA ligase [Actinomycetota bacterium]|nr:threonine--tRNA ligase [Actinomycetota bacterium]